MVRNGKIAAKSDIFRERLRAARLAAGMTQAQVSDLAGISTVTLSKLEQGVNLPTLDVMVALSRVLQVSPNFLVGWESRIDSTDVPERKAVLLRLEAATEDLEIDWLQILLSVAERVAKDDKTSK